TLRTLAVSGRGLVDVLRDRGRADEADGLDAVVVQNRVDGLLVTVDDVENARGQPCLNEELGDAQRDGGVALTGLKDERVTCGERRAHLPQRDHGREVEGRDARDDPQRLAHRIHVDTRAGSRGILTLKQVRSTDGELNDLDTALDVAEGV